MKDIQITYTYSNLLPHAITTNRHLCSMTLNMNMKDFHTPALIGGLLYSLLDKEAPDSLVEAILTYPHDALDGKDVTVVFSYT